MPLDPRIAGLADAMARDPDARPMNEQSPAEAREGYRLLGGMFGPGADVGSVADRAVPGPAGDVSVRVYRPEAQDGALPVLVFYHGGGFTIGDLDTHDRECRALCNGVPCVVVAVDYRLAPEHPFPAAVDDGFAALQWVGANAGEIGGDPARIAVAGDSAGGNLSAVMALLARDAGGPELRFQLLVYPAVDLRAGRDGDYPSREQNAEGPFLTKDTMEWFTDHYLGDDATARADLRASPLVATSHAGLPPALVVTAELDPLRDEGAAYVRALEKAGVPVRHRDWAGIPHVFFQLSALIGNDLLDECSAALREAFA